ncbi:MAG: metalloregulator ArsR/SmtB family transcription factor [Anaerolineae bacterium]|nr:metalloregulator ArsR/SmtB family transcription factor [Anaerolineae bacterium]
MTMRTKPPSPVTFARALADDTRQSIMELTCCRWMNVSEIQAEVGVSQPTVSHHLAILREAGLVQVRSEGKHTYYSLNQENVVMCCGKLMLTFAPETETTRAVREVME